MVESRLDVLYFFFYKQKTADEMRISDWSSDVCSSDLEVRIDDVAGVAVDDRLLVSVDRIGLGRRDEGRADIGEVGAHRLRREDRAAVGDRARQRERPVEPRAYLLDERERRQPASMAAGARRDRAQTGQASCRERGCQSV